MSDPIKQPEQQAEQAQPTASEVDYENMPRSDYLQLPKEEQDRLYALRKQRVRDAPTLYEWDIRVAVIYGLGWLTILIPCGILALIGGMMMHGGDNGGWGGIIMAVLIGLCARYLWFADRLYHYRLTTEGLVETEREAIPDVAYTVVRGLAWFGAVVCIMAVAVMGPAALVGAGGFAVGAFFFTGFKNKETSHVSLFNPQERYVMKVTRNRPFVRCEEGVLLPNQCSTVEFFCSPANQHKIMSMIAARLTCEEIRLFENEFKLKRSPFASFDAGEPAQLSDFAPRSADS